MRRPLLLLLLVLAAAPLAAATVSGKVILLKKGTPLPDASNAVVWIEGVRGGGGPAASRGQMRSDQKKFAPRVVALRVNGTVDFPNADAIYHNVFSVSGGNRFDLGLYRSGASKDKKFEAPGLVRVYCNIHPQMVGFVMVVDSDFAAVTGPDGAFRFDEVPAGSHTVRVWHEEAGESQAAPVTVHSGPGAPVILRLDVTSFRPIP